MLKITGLNEMTKKLDDLAKRAKALDGEHSVRMDELLTPAFVSKHTRFADVDALFAASGFRVETEEDLAAIPDDKWDDFIRSISPFPDWAAMLRKATEEWAAKQLGFELVSQLWQTAWLQRVVNSGPFSTKFEPLWRTRSRKRN